MNCLNYKSRFITSDLLLGSAVGDTGEESQIGELTLSSPSLKGHCRLLTSLYQGPLVASSLGVVQAPSDASSGISTLSFPPSLHSSHTFVRDPVLISLHLPHFNVPPVYPWAPNCQDTTQIKAMSKAMCALELREERRTLSQLVDYGMLNRALKVGYREAERHAWGGQGACLGAEGAYCVVLVSFNSSPHPSTTSARGGRPGNAVQLL